jgi:hypothetical protein
VIAIFVQPSGYTVLDLTFPVLVHPVANRIPGIGELADPPAGAAVVVIGIEIDLASVVRNAITVGPSLITGNDVTFSARTPVLGMVEEAAVPAGTAMLHIRHQVNAVIGREDPALGEPRSAGTG